VNSLAGHDCAFDVGESIVAGGRLFADSGSAQRNGLPGNMLLAFQCGDEVMMWRTQEVSACREFVCLRSSCSA
jgi:hypothetical protein